MPGLCKFSVGHIADYHKKYFFYSQMFLILQKFLMEYLALFESAVFVPV
jgi:hypothetical protein